MIYGLKYYLILISFALLTSNSSAQLACKDIFLSQTQTTTALTSKNVESGAKSEPQEDYSAYPDLNAKYQQALKLVPENMKDAQGRLLSANSESPVLSIVIPAYKEATRIPKSIETIKQFFKDYPFPVEVMIRIEKSPDNTVEVAEQAAQGADYITIYDHGIQRGKGYAVRQGMLDARGDFVLFMDADLATPLPEIYNFLSYIEKNPNIDVLIADRRHPESQIEQKQSASRQLMGYTFSKVSTGIIAAFGLKGVYDTQAGFKLFRQQPSIDIFSRMQTDGFAFDVEALIYANQLGYNVKSIPIHWQDQEGSTVNKFTEPVKMLVDMMKIHSKVIKEIRNQSPQTHNP